MLVAHDNYFLFTPMLAEVVADRGIQKAIELTGRIMERVIGFEPTTSCLASTRSTN
jgi:hypothetical protein